MPVVNCNYSTISPSWLMAHVIPTYCLVEPLSCELWERGANDTYLLECANGRFFMRIYRHGAFTKEANEFEAEALHYLHRQGCPVAHPVELKAGGFITTVAAPEGSRCVLVTAAAEGRSAVYDSTAVCAQIGASVARLHEAARGFETSLRRPQLDLDFLLHGSMLVIRDYFAQDTETLSIIEAIAAAVDARVRDVADDALSWGICHGDLHGGNCHVHNDVVTHFDFEECAFGFQLYDLATFKWDTCGANDERPRQRWQAFVDAYDSHKPLSETERGLADTFVILRELSEMSYGIRHVAYFGRDCILASNAERVRSRLQEMAEIAKLAC